MAAFRAGDRAVTPPKPRSDLSAKGLTARTSAWFPISSCGGAALRITGTPNPRGRFVPAHRIGIHECGLEAILFKTRNGLCYWPCSRAWRARRLEPGAAHGGDIELLPCARQHQGRAGRSGARIRSAASWSRLSSASRTELAMMIELTRPP
jgi:hypothetical protein